MDQEIGTKQFSVSVVVPLYREEKNVRAFVERLSGVLTSMGCEWEVIFALDPSPDKTEDIVLGLMDEGYPLKLVKFSRRIGKPLSVLAGINQSQSDVTVIIDVDLQDPPELIEEMVKKWQEGFKVVLAQRTARRGENVLYLLAARLFYWIMAKCGEYPIPGNTGDFRLLDRRVVAELGKCEERHGFLRGLTAAVGFKTAIIPFARDPRHHGKANISLLGAVNIALDGLIPFSRVPVRMIFVLGSVITVLGLLGTVACFSWRAATGLPQHWFLMIILSQFVLGGIGIAALGIVGEYVVRTYEESRRRPQYVIESIVTSKEREYGKMYGMKGTDT